MNIFFGFLLIIVALLWLKHSYLKKNDKKNPILNSNQVSIYMSLIFLILLGLFIIIKSL
jgi:ABC-type transport system involved in multi-copper enzyme maturation permease subunit